MLGLDTFPNTVTLHFSPVLEVTLAMEVRMDLEVILGR